MTTYHPYRPAAWIKVTGDDAFTFLQGQLSNDLRVAPGRGCVYGLWLNHKGKVLGDSFVLRTGEHEFFVASYSSPAATILSRLEPYIVADDVILEDRTGRAFGVAFWGGGAGEPGAALGMPLPPAGEYLVNEGDFVFPGRRTAGPSWEWILEDELSGARLRRARELLAAAGAAEVNEGAVETERIRAGIPAVPADIGPADLPGEGGLEEAAISYTKGCYLGQEVMARLHSMGQVRRTLVRVFSAELPPPLPAALHVGDRKAGEWRSAAPAAGRAGWIGHALLSRSLLADAQDFSLFPNGEPLVRVWSQEP